MPFIHVIIPCYNVEKYLEQAVYSVLNQPCKEIDIVLVDEISRNWENTERLWKAARPELQRGSLRTLRTDPPRTKKLISPSNMHENLPVTYSRKESAVS